MKGVLKQNLPEKICSTCMRPFSWRKKWERDWEAVKYCSQKCGKKRLFSATYVANAMLSCQH